MNLDDIIQYLAKVQSTYNMGWKVMGCGRGGGLKRAVKGDIETKRQDVVFCPYIAVPKLKLKPMPMQCSHGECHTL